MLTVVAQDEQENVSRTTPKCFLPSWSLVINLWHELRVKKILKVSPLLVSPQVHQLLNNWNEPQKANFIRHVTREYEVW